MASLLRSIVAGPRARHDETGLDLCYVTSNIIATSGPSQTYPQLAYRNPLDRLVAFLDKKHGDRWAIWEFRAEGTGYPDAAVYNRIRHYPWPDHHPPPFGLVPVILASMKQWLAGGASSTDGSNDNSKENTVDTKGTTSDRVVVVHCKAGKGRSGTMACSYLIAECGWTPKDALDRFTARRMRPQFGSGVAIPSQLRWIGYVDRWTKCGKPAYVDRAVEIVEIHVWGLRHGVKLSVEGYVDEGKKIHVFHTFRNSERYIVEGGAPGGAGLMDLVSDMAGTTGKAPGVDSPGEDAPDDMTPGGSTPSAASTKSAQSRSASPHPDGASGRVPRPRTDLLIGGGMANMQQLRQSRLDQSAGNSRGSRDSSPSPSPKSRKATFRFASQDEPGGQAVLFKPDTPIRVPSSDVNIALERRNRTSTMGLTMVTSVAHVWFNAYFEGNGPEQGGRPDDSGIFFLDWDKLDGIKGSSQKGSRAAERIAVVWRTAKEGGDKGDKADKEDEKVQEELDASDKTAVQAADIPQMKAADWKGDNSEDPDSSKRLGLRHDDPGSADVSRASSVKAVPTGEHHGAAETGSDDTLAGVKTSGPEGEALGED